MSHPQNTYNHVGGYPQHATQSSPTSQSQPLSTSLGSLSPSKQRTWSNIGSPSTSASADHGPRAGFSMTDFVTSSTSQSSSSPLASSRSHPLASSTGQHAPSQHTLTVQPEAIGPAQTHLSALLQPPRSSETDSLLLMQSSTSPSSAATPFPSAVGAVVSTTPSLPQGPWLSIREVQQSRSSSAPPTQPFGRNRPCYTNGASESYGQQGGNVDPRANPDYAAFFYSNSRLDPRLPPPIYSPGQSWQMWAIPNVTSSVPTAFEDSVRGNRTLKSTQNHWQDVSGFGQDPSSSSLYGPSAVRQISPHQHPQPHQSHQFSFTPTAHNRRRNLVDLIQEDFPRTPSPVYGQLQVRPKSIEDEDDYVLDLHQATDASVIDELTREELLEGHLSSMTPPPSAQMLGSNFNQYPPRASSTPPMMASKLRSERSYVASPLNHAAEIYPDPTGMMSNLQNLSLVDPDSSLTYYRAPMHAPPPQQQNLPTKQFMDNSAAMITHSTSNPPGMPSFVTSYELTMSRQDTGRWSRPHASRDPYSGFQRVSPAEMGVADSYGSGLSAETLDPRMYAPSPHVVISPAGIGDLPNGALQLNHPMVYHDRKVVRDGASYLVGRTGSPSHFHSPKRDARSEAPPHAFRSPILEEFRNAKSRKYELRDILGHVVEFSGDQHGSRFIQQKLETASSEDKQLIFEELLPNVLQLIADVFGNYVIQKFFEHGNQTQKTQIAKQMDGHILSLSMQMYGCRVVQKALEHVLVDQQASLIRELDGSVLKCVKDQNGNHVIQKAIERIPVQHIQFIIDGFKGQIYELATHPYGCRVMQRIFEHCPEELTSPLLKELYEFIHTLVQDQYGNYVIQHILEKGRAADKAVVIGKIRGQLLTLSKHKFASNVVEKCIIAATSSDRQLMIEEIIQSRLDGTTPLVQMMKDQYANYVVQKLLDLSEVEQRNLLISRISPHFGSLRKFTYGKHILAKIEKLTGQRIQDIAVDASY